LALLFTWQLWWLHRTRFLRGERQQEAASALYTRQARQFVRFAVRMGGLIVKLGQFMSVRIDLLPKEYIDELSQLQDSLPAVETDQIIGVIEAELGQPLSQLYATFDRTPIAAASLGQVHRATLPDGRPAAVKVLRPGIERLVSIDLRSLRTILRLLDKRLRLGDFTDISRLDADFTATFSDELDFRKEGRNAETCQRNLLMNPHVDIPQIFWDRSAQRVLTMEYMTGVRIDDLAAIDAAGIDRHTLAENLAGVFFQMVLNDGFYHADPHPGNVLIREDGIIQLIDFGMVGSVTPLARDHYAVLVLSLVKRDAAGIVRALKDLGFLGPGADTKALTNMIAPYIDALVGDVTNFYTRDSFVDAMMRGNLKLSLDTAALAQIQHFIFTQPITLPGGTTFLGKALITVLGLCLRLDPDLDVIATAAPYVTGSSPIDTLSDLVERGLKEGKDLLGSILPTTRRLISVAQKLDDGTLEVELSRSLERRLAASQQRQTRRLVRVIGIGLSVIAVVLGVRRR
jgi:predicted unusual protein kinase regulating ubiquinone biosynthesis (AarF/ABC1/UbiB family)